MVIWLMNVSTIPKRKFPNTVAYSIETILQNTKYNLCFLSSNLNLFCIENKSGQQLTITLVLVSTYIYNYD